MIIGVRNGGRYCDRTDGPLAVRYLCRLKADPPVLLTWGSAERQ